MAADIVIPSDALVVVADHSKALFFVNTGAPFSPDLVLLDKLEAQSNPPTHDQGEDRPGRAAMGAHRSSYSQTDWHDLGGAEFMTTVADRLATVSDQQDAQSLVIVAPPRALSEMRKKLSPAVQSLVVCEFDKDLTHLPVAEINAHLTSS